MKERSLSEAGPENPLRGRTGRSLPVRLSSALFVLVILLASVSEAGFLDELKRGLDLLSGKRELSVETIVSGLTEALSIATGNAVESVSRVDGYLGDPRIRIPFPEDIRDVADVLARVGFKREVDEFTRSMNRAAEQAAPWAASLFLDAITALTFDDARRILEGGETAATEYFRRMTYDHLFAAFRPAISSSMDRVGVTRSYKRMVDAYNALPLVPERDMDLDEYVTRRALEGLFLVVSEEERKIRTDPAARVTDLLREVFGTQ